jgi:hypothetical protein
MPDPLKYTLLIIIGLVVVAFAAYLITRMISAAYFYSKREHIARLQAVCTPKSKGELNR